MVASKGVANRDSPHWAQRAIARTWARRSQRVCDVECLAGRLARLRVRWMWVTHPTQPAPVGADSVETTVMHGIADPELGAGSLHDIRDARIVNVADAGKQVVLDLEVEATDVPAQQAVVSPEIDRGFHLVHSPGPRHSLDVGCERGKFGLLDAVR